VNQRTQRGQTQLNGDDVVSVELIEDSDTPAAAREPALVLIHWPRQATTCDAKRFSDMAAVVARLFATAATELASIKSRRKL
jgi:hypothetical protein